MKEQIPFYVISITENLFPRIISEKKHFREVINSRGVGRRGRKVVLCLLTGWGVWN